MLIRISEIEVFPAYLTDYMKFALTVGETSVREEPGVIAIFPMVQKRDSTQIRIIEIYQTKKLTRHTSPASISKFTSKAHYTW